MQHTALYVFYRSQSEGHGQQRELFRNNLVACPRLTGDRRYYIIFLPALSQLYCETYKASGAGVLQLSPSLDTLSRWSAWKRTFASSHLPQEERGLCHHHQDAPTSWHSSKPADDDSLLYSDISSDAEAIATSGLLSVWGIFIL